MSRQIVISTLENVYTPLPDIQATYRRLLYTFASNEAYALFAEPVLLSGSNRIVWQTNLTGTIIPWTQLDSEGRKHTETLLKKHANELIRQSADFGQDDILIQTLHTCLATPSRECVFLIRSADDNPENDRAVLTEWSMLSELPGTQKGWLSDLITTQRYDMVISVNYKGSPPVPAEGIALIAGYDQKEETHYSNNAGFVFLPLVKAGTEVTISYRNPGTGRDERTTFFCYENARYQLVLDRQAPQTAASEQPNIPAGSLVIKIVDRRQKPVADASVDIEIGDHVVESAISDEQGIAIFPDQPDGTQCIAYARKGRRKGRLTFLRKSSVPEYTVQIRDNNLYWLFLSLLFLLFIPLKQELIFKVESEAHGAPVVDTLVRLHMPDASIARRITNSDGLVTFDSLPRIMIWKKLWIAIGGSGGTPVMANILSGECLEGDTISGILENLVSAAQNKRTFRLKAVTAVFKFITLEKDGPVEEPLPDTYLTIRLEDGTVIRDTTDASGISAAHRLPVCNRINVVAEHQHYVPDTLDKRGTEIHFPAPAEERSLFLVPKKTLTRFYVKDCTNKNPIAGAKVTLTAESDEHAPRVITVNTNGRVAGVDIDIYDRETTIRLEARHPAYHDSLIAGHADDLRRASIENRTIWMCPRKNAPLVRVIDRESRQALAGAMVQVDSAGRKISLTTNADGEVRLPPGRVDATINIEASKLPEYLLNRDFSPVKIGDLPAPVVIIPLEKEKLAPCDGRTNSGGKGDTTIVVYLGKRVDRFQFQFDMENIPDQAYIYFGGIGGAEVWHTDGPVSGKHSELISFGANGKTDIVAIRMIGADDKTSWSFTVVCPD